MSREVDCFLDQPAEDVLDNSVVPLRGWIAARVGGLRGISIRSVQGPVRLKTYARPDVLQVFDGLDVLGFSGTLYVADHLAGIADSRLILYVICASRVVGGFRFEVTKRALSAAVQLASGG